MQIISFLITTTIFTAAAFLLYYYVTLFFSKTEFHKHEFLELGPYFSFVKNRLLDNNALPGTLLYTVVPFLLAFFLTKLTRHWLANSIILFALLYYGLPFILDTFVKNKIAHGDEHTAKAMLQLLENHQYGLFIFGASLLAGFTLNWIKHLNSSLLFYAVNLFASFILFYHLLKSLLAYDKILSQEPVDQPQTTEGETVASQQTETGDENDEDAQ